MDGVVHYVMESIDGYSLEDLVEAFGALPAGRGVRITSQVCAALVEAHGIGLIHRDIKPANVAPTERARIHDVVKVLDFGLVKELGKDVAMTSAATLTGTPLYLAPEALTGGHVFDGETVVEVCSHHLHTVPERPSARLGAPVPHAIVGRPRFSRTSLGLAPLDVDLESRDARTQVEVAA